MPSDTNQPSIFVAYGFSGWIKGTCSNEKKIGITAAQRALGFRATMIMNKIGVKEDEIKYFITDILNRCNDIGFSAQNVAIYLQDVLEFSVYTNILISKKII